MTERFRDDGRPLNEYEQSAWDGLAGLLAQDAELGASNVQFNTNFKDMIPVMDQEPSVSETGMLLPEDAIKEDEIGLYVDMESDEGVNSSSASLLERDPWYLSDAETGWKPSGAPMIPSDAREALESQKKAEADMPWYQRKIARVVGAASCFGAAAAAIVAGATGFLPASPQLPDTLLLRDKVARDTALLKSLGICASELRAQYDLDSTVITRPSGRQIKNLEITALAIRTAEKHSLPCISSSGQEVAKIDGAPIERSDVTIYKDTNWCDQRKEISDEVPLNTEHSRIEVLAIGNRHFGFRCQ